MTVETLDRLPQYYLDEFNPGNIPQQDVYAIANSVNVAVMDLGMDCPHGLGTDLHLSISAFLYGRENGNPFLENAGCIAFHQLVEKASAGATIGNQFWLKVLQATSRFAIPEPVWKPECNG